MTKLGLLTAAFLALAVPALAETEAALDAATEARVKTELTAQGYEVRSVGMEDGMIEVYAVKDGKMLELYLDADLKIVRTGGE